MKVMTVLVPIFHYTASWTFIIGFIFWKRRFYA